MPALARLAPWQHLVVGGSAAAVGIAAFTGLIGEDRPEHFDAKQVVIAPEGENGLRITETVDHDFGDQQRHGYQRIIPVDFGEPTDVVATATDAPDDLDVESMGWETRIRIGDPQTTVTGQHRYTLAYTLPDARLSSGELALDVIGTDESLETDRFEVILTGLELDDPTCNVGGFGDVGGCELVDDGETYRVEFSPLDAGDGITIGGRIVGRRDVVDVEPPPLPDAPPDRRVPLGIATTAVGLATGAGTFAWARRRGRNEVAPGGAADVAFGFSSVPLPPPPAGTAVTTSLAPPDASFPHPPRPADAPSSPAGGVGVGSGVRLVTDAELAELSTTEFAPPAGVDPWLGRVLLNERFDNETVAAWLSAHASRDVLTVAETDGKVELAVGPRFDTAPREDQTVLRRMIGGDRIVLGKYSKQFAAGWSDIAKRQRQFVTASGFWKRPIGSSGAGGTGIALVVLVAAVAAMLFAGRALRASPVLGSPVVAVLLAIVVPGIAALLAYRRLLPARTVSGSALAIRTESFRRFLAASEARHVEWAWEHGMLREYSAWAVALGTADAWESAMRGSTVPPAEFNAAPILLYHHASAIGSTRTAPSSSGSGGGGGFSGGFSGGSVGGGGGGGSSGSW
jgi:uncharacterized membrane protein YgcG